MNARLIGYIIGALIALVSATYLSAWGTLAGISIMTIIFLSVPKEIS